MTAQFRLRTQGVMVETIESRADGASIKLYGPFATADAQRAFMRSQAESLPPSPEKSVMLEAIETWRREDEDEA